MPAPTLAKSAAPNRWLSTATSGSTLSGSDSHRDQLAANTGSVTLIGGKLDDTYIAYSTSTKIIEQAAGGIDTVVTWGNGYTLGANLENLTLMGGAHSSATGNAASNLIIGNDGNNRITTGGGNDVLVGSKGADTYVPTKSGDSVTWITGFKTTGSTLDKIDLRGFGIDGFAGIQSRMAQVGADLRIDLGNGQQVMLENKAKSEFTAAHFQVEGSTGTPTGSPGTPTGSPGTPSGSPGTPSGGTGTPSGGTGNTPGLSNLVRTFSDEFNSLGLYSTWQPHDGWGNRTLSGNNELQLYVDPKYKGLGLNPFSIDNGVLTITGAKTSSSHVSQLNGYKYTSGMLSTHDSFAQQYGYFEIRAQMTAEQGMWPAFWMLSTNGKWPPELDVVEMVGKNPYSVVQTMHTKAGKNSGKTTTSATNLADGFHTYGMDWNASKITFYFDGKVTHQVATPADMHTPMYMMVNLAVGGNWPGSPDATTDWSKSNMKVDYIRAYKHGSSSTPPVVTPPATTPPATNPPEAAPPATTPPVTTTPPATTPPATNPPEAAPPATTPPVTTPPTTAGLRGEISQGMDHFGDSFTAVATGANTSTTYAGSQLKIDGIASNASLKVAYGADNGLTLTNQGAWGAIKNARVESDSSGSVTIDNFVDADVSLGNGADTVTVKSAKRGSIDTGGGNDRITVTGFSNDGNFNVMKINAGDGDDAVSISGAANVRTAIIAGAGNDTITISGQAGGTVNAGIGNDRIVAATSGTVTAVGGAGRDVFEFIRSAHATISDFNAAEDSIVVRGGSASTVQLRASNGSTIVDLGNGASVILTGVTTPASGINMAFA